MPDLATVFAGRHARTIWCLEEIAYCLEAYFGYTAETAVQEVLDSPRLQAVLAGEQERILWHLLPTEWATKVARDRDPHVSYLDEATARLYQATRYRNTPPKPGGG